MDETLLKNELQKWFDNNNIYDDKIFKSNEIAILLKSNLMKYDRWKRSPKFIQGIGRESFFEQAWQGMPEFTQKDLMPIKTLMVHFENYDNLKNFSNLVNQKIGPKTKSIWYPKQELIKPSDYEYIDEP